jgi:L-2-hydroxyglutarate oxidase LhgO
VAGQRLLYLFLEANGVAYRRCGKLIVATSNEESRQIEETFLK